MIIFKQSRDKANCDTNKSFKQFQNEFQTQLYIRGPSRNQREKETRPDNVSANSQKILGQINKLNINL